ncbi:MAG: polar amino acid transport system permease protein [Clostridia bacterium]|jgi:polar amino acid transport system permease protein|nr:polar amino acid transporter, inner rane subunit [Clostridiales bacterium]MDK2986623.1 polar amino acid transport system permease protein [Clostridia bacterium]
MGTIQFILSILPLLLQGAVVTLELTLSSFFLGTILGLFLALMKITKISFFRKIAGFYIWFFRGVPLIVQIMFIFYGLGSIGIKLDRLPAGVLAMSLCGAAYIAEIIRAGIQSIEKGQMEAALSLGMTYSQAMRRIIIPQTYRRLVPPMCNEFILLLKDAALVAVIGGRELLRVGQTLDSAYFRSLEIYGAVALVYLFLTTIFTIIFDKIENRFAIYE